MKKFILNAGIYAFGVLLMFSAVSVEAQQMVKGEEIVLDDTAIEEIVDNISTILEENYIFQETAKKMADYIKEKMDNGDYANIKDPSQLAGVLTSDLQKVSEDLHLRVRFSPGIKQAIEDAKKNREQAEKEQLKKQKFNNFGFAKVERLDGNIGYIDLRGFMNAEHGKNTVASAMGFIENCDAVIFDLRQNGGGAPNMVQLISSYFFDETPVHLNSLYYRPADTTEEYWTLKEVQGKRMPDVDLYVLTSGRTFSAAEEFTYNLKNLNRATIIGETTGGGAHPGGTMVINDYMGMFVPTGRAINPITKTNWEGTGVKPDIEVSNEKALLKAQITALEKIKMKSSPETAGQYDLTLEKLKVQIEPYVLTPSAMQEYAGKFDVRTITLEDGNLYYQRQKRPKMKMIPLTKDKFMFNEINYFVLRFDRDNSGNIISVTGMYDNGNTDKSLKSD